MHRTPEKKLKFRLFIILLFLISFTVGLFLSDASIKKHTGLGEKAALDYATDFVDKCSSERIDNTQCYSKLLYNTTLEQGMDFSLEILSLLQKKDPQALRCHFIAHAIGEGIYLQSKADWKEILSDVPTVCSYGISHGILESFFNDKDIVNVVEDNRLPEICHRARPSCHHSMGHVIMLETGGNIEESIDACSLYPEGEGRNYCYNGVFMEYISPRILIEHGVLKESRKTSTVHLSELVNFCNSFNEEVLAQCWGELSQPAVEVFLNDEKSLFNFCTQAPNSAAIKQCHARVIANFVVANQPNLVKTKKICSFFEKDEDVESCYLQIVDVALGQSSDYSGVKEFCATLKDPFLNRCLGKIK